MGIPVPIYGRSGAGKSYSMRNMPEDNFGLINVLDKPLPFRNKIKSFVSTDYGAIKHALKEAKSKSIVLDDAGFLITDMFMSRHSSCGGGNAVFSLYNDIGDSFYQLMRFIVEELPPDVIVYVIMHEDSDESGRSKIKTIGKLLDEKVTIEALATVVILATGAENDYMFQVNGEGIVKSPPDMFENDLIPNDLYEIDKTIRDYYDLCPLSGDAK